MDWEKFSEIAENDSLRSVYLFEHIIKDYSEENKSEDFFSEIPKQIIQYWDSKEIPTDVGLIMDTWSKSGLDMIVYNRESAKEFIKEYGNETQINAFEMCMHPAMRADYFRLLYLYMRGGLYVDADNKYNKVQVSSFFINNKIKIYPLCYDRETDKMVEISHFFYDTKPNSNYIYYINNDPIFAPPKHPLIKLALNRATNNIIDKKENFKNIQSIAGPGNLTASIVQYCIKCKQENSAIDIEFLKNWNKISTPQWDLEYRKDQRNWRIWTGDSM